MQIMTANDKSRIRFEKGFSLIELIIVCLVIAIMVTFSIPAIERNLRLYRLESAVGLVSDRLREARFSAVKRNRSVWVSIDATTKSIEIWSTNDLGQPISLTNAVLLPRNIALKNPVNTTVTFTSLGRNQTNSN